MGDLGFPYPVDRLTGLVGLVARGSATVKPALHELLRELDSRGEADWRRHKDVVSISDLVKKCKTAIQSPPAPPALTDCLAVLQSACVTNLERNAAIHGVWNKFRSGQLTSWRYKRGDGLVPVPMTENELEHVAVALARTALQIKAIRFLVYDQTTGAQAVADPEWQREVKISEAIVCGQFELAGWNDFKLRGPH